MLDRAYDFEGEAFQPVLDVLQRSAPVTVLDVPHAWSEWTRSVLASVDEVVICAIPDLANLRNAKNMLDALRKLRPNDKAPHLILNQVGMPKRPEIGVAEFCEPMETDPIAIIPFDIAMFGNAANSGRMISETDPKSPTAETFSQIAHIVTGRVAVRKAKRGGLLGLLGRK
jgi:pilus assembly protein CpaE